MVSYEDHMENLVNYCLGELFHGEYKRKLVWPKNPRADDKDDECTTATITIDNTYLSAVFRFYPVMKVKWKDKDYRHIGSIVLHECCHLFIDPVADIYRWNQRPSEKEDNQNIVERQTTRIENAIFDLLPDDWYMPNVVAGVMKKVARLPKA